MFICLFFFKCTLPKRQPVLAVSSQVSWSTSLCVLPSKASAIHAFESVWSSLLLSCICSALCSPGSDNPQLWLSLSFRSSTRPMAILGWGKWDRFEFHLLTAKGCSDLPRRYVLLCRCIVYSKNLALPQVGYALIALAVFRVIFFGRRLPSERKGIAGMKTASLESK